LLHWFKFFDLNILKKCIGRTTGGIRPNIAKQVSRMPIPFKMFDAKKIFFPHHTTLTIFNVKERREYVGENPNLATMYARTHASRGK
jgi:hypothetical protein